MNHKKTGGDYTPLYTALDYDDAITLTYIPCKPDTLMPVLLQSTSIEFLYAMYYNLDDDIFCLSELSQLDFLPTLCLLTKLLIPQILILIFSSKFFHPFLFLLCCFINLLLHWLNITVVFFVVIRNCTQISLHLLPNKFSSYAYR